MLLGPGPGGLGRKTEALEELDQGLADNPGNVSFLLAKGNILVGLERRPEAIRSLPRP